MGMGIRRLVPTERRVVFLILLISRMRFEIDTVPLSDPCQRISLLHHMGLKLKPLTRSKRFKISEKDLSLSARDPHFIL